ncbi:MAG: hypothetical protein AVDCRST_MAG76-3377, partial [uncultured Acidimicrobiales bacterium]
MAEHGLIAVVQERSVLRKAALDSVRHGGVTTFVPQRPQVAVENAAHVHAVVVDRLQHALGAEIAKLSER